MNWGELLATCTRMTAAQRAVLRRQIQPVVPSGEVFTDSTTPGQQLVLWIADWLADVCVVPYDQVQVLLLHIANDLMQLGNWWFEDFQGQHPVRGAALLTFLDRRYAVWNQTLIDLATGETPEAPPEPAIEVISYSLPTLFKRRLDAHLSHDAEDAAAATDPEAVSAT